MNTPIPDGEITIMQGKTKTYAHFTEHTIFPGPHMKAWNWYCVIKLLSYEHGIEVAMIKFYLTPYQLNGHYVHYHGGPTVIWLFVLISHMFHVSMVRMCSLFGICTWHHCTGYYCRSWLIGRRLLCAFHHMLVIYSRHFRTYAWRVWCQTK